MGLFDRLASTLAGNEDIADDLRAEIERAFADLATGDPDAAEARLVIASEDHKDVPTVFVALGEVRARAGRDEGAVDAFSRAVNLSAHMVDGWLGLGEALLRLGRIEPAREAFRKVLARTGELTRRARAHAGRGRIALAMGEPARAVRELREAAGLAPLDYATAHELGRGLQAMGDPEAASWLARAAHAPAPLPEWVLAAARAAPSPTIAKAILRGGLDAVGTDRRAARAALEAALALQLCRDGGEPEPVAEALALAEAAIERAPTDPVGYDAKACVVEAAGDPRGALEAAERALALGAPLDLSRWIGLALVAGDKAACLRFAAPHAAQDPLAAAAVAFAEGRAQPPDLIRLGTLPRVAGDEAARRFVASAASPGAVPTGNLYGLLTFARALATEIPALGSLVPLAARAVEAFDRPLLVAVMGEFNAGKSSFVNALCGEVVAEVGVTPTTATINVLRYGPRGGRVLFHDGRAQELEASALVAFLRGLDDAGAAVIRMVEIFLPVELLRRVEIVDTPGLNSLRPEHEAIARGFLTDADAIVWLFSVNQAAKATERDALRLAQAAGKRVLGVLNKADQASAEEIAEIETHVGQSLGDLVEVLRPFSAKRALGRRAGGAKSGDEARDKSGVDDESALGPDGGLAAIEAALEERFFSRARSLKRQTALGALGRFVGEAEALASAGQPRADSSNEDAVDNLVARQEALLGTLASLRVSTRARLEAGFRQAGAELAELFEPRRHRILGDRTAAPDEDRRFLLELLEDAVFEATALASQELEAAAQGGPALPIAELLERFRAYARGLFRGGVIDEILRLDAAAPLVRKDAGRLSRALMTVLPDPDAELFVPLGAAVKAAFAEALAAHEAALRTTELAALIHEARLVRPLRDLAAALRAVGDESDGAHGGG